MEAEVKYLLSCSLLLCFFSLFRHWPKYRLTCLYLLVCIPATLAFKAESEWLKAWYLLLVGPVVVCRLLAAIEVCHRQTAGFRYWWRLMGSVFLIAGLFAALSWVESPRRDVLQSFVDIRRLAQIWTGAVFVVLEGFWISQGGALYRRADRAAAAFGLLSVNHALVSIASLTGGWSAGSWWAVSEWSWGVDAVCYLWMAVIFRRVPDGLIGR